MNPRGLVSQPSKTIASERRTRPSPWPSSALAACRQAFDFTIGSVGWKLWDLVVLVCSRIRSELAYPKLNPKPEDLNPEPETLNPKPEILNLKP